MKWIDAVINESLRLGGPVPTLMSRINVEKITAGGLEIPKDTFLNIFVIMNQYDKEIFEKPFEFLP